MLSKRNELNLYNLTYEEKIELAETTNDIKVLKFLLKDKDETIRLSILENPLTTIDMINSLVKDKDDFVRGIISYNEKLTLKNILKLSKSKDFLIRLGLLNNPNTPYNLKMIFFEELSKCKINDELLVNIKYCPSYLLEKFSKNENDYIKSSVAKHQNTPNHILEVLSKSDNKYIKLNVLINPNTNILLAKKLFLNIKKDKKDIDYMFEYFYNNGFNTKFLNFLAKSKNKLIKKSYEDFILKFDLKKEKSKQYWIDNQKEKKEILSYFSFVK